MSILKWDDHSLTCQVGQSLERIGHKAGFGLFPVADYRGPGGFKSFNGILDGPVEMQVEVLCCDAASGMSSHGFLQRRRAGHTANRFSGYRSNPGRIFNTLIFHQM